MDPFNLSLSFFHGKGDNMPRLVDLSKVTKTSWRPMANLNVFGVISRHMAYTVHLIFCHDEGILIFMLSQNKLNLDLCMGYEFTYF